MERDNPQFSRLQYEFRLALTYWKTAPDSPKMVAKMKGLLQIAKDERLDLVFGVKNSIFDNPEALRAVDPQEMAKYARRTGDIWMFHLKPGTGDPKIRVMAADLWDKKMGRRGNLYRYNFVMRVKEGDGWQDALILRPNELAGITVK